MSNKKLVHMDYAQAPSFAMIYTLREAERTGLITEEVMNRLALRVDELLMALLAGHVLSPDATTGVVEIIPMTDYKTQEPGAVPMSPEDVLAADEFLVIGGTKDDA